MAAPVCPGAASALKKAAQACFDAASALKMAILACSGATSALKKPARARFSATECAQRGCSSLLFEITIQKCWSRLHSALSHCTLLHFASCMDMHGYTLVSIQKSSFVVQRVCTLWGFSAPLLHMRKHRYLPHGSHFGMRKHRYLPHGSHFGDRK